MDHLHNKYRPIGHCMLQLNDRSTNVDIFFGHIVNSILPRRSASQMTVYFSVVWIIDQKIKNVDEIKHDTKQALPRWLSIWIVAILQFCVAYLYCIAPHSPDKLKHWSW